MKEDCITLSLHDGRKINGKIFYVSALNKSGDCLIKLKDGKENYVTLTLKQISCFQTRLV